MPKICFITTIQLTMDTFVVPFAKVLAENGYDVTYICNMNEEFKEKNGSYAKCLHLPMNRGFHFLDIFKFTSKLTKIFKFYSLILYIIIKKVSKSLKIVLRYLTFYGKIME